MNSVRTGRTADLMRRKKSGQTMTETIIVVGLIAIAAIVAVGVFGGGVKEGFANMYSRLTGKTTTSDFTDTSGQIKNVGTETKMDKFD